MTTTQEYIPFDGAEQASAPVISREQPLQTAAEFHRTSGERLRRYRHTWYRWEGTNYRMVSSEEASVDITTFLASGVDPNGEQFHPRPSDVSATLQMLMRHPPAIIKPTVPLPRWLPEATDAERDHDPLDLISCKNGLVDLRTDERMPHTPHLLATSTTSYDHRPQAKRKRFEKFLDEIFPGSAAASHSVRTARISLCLVRSSSRQWKTSTLDQMFETKSRTWGKHETLHLLRGWQAR
jgi:hypothetical protein